MNFIKKFAKEISVFGLVLLIFLGLFIYRQATFKDQEDFVVVLGDSTDSTMTSYQEIMTTYTTKNRSTPFYYLDTSEIKDIDSYVEKTFDTNVSYPATFVIKDGKVVAKKEGYNQYYSLYDMILL